MLVMPEIVIKLGLAEIQQALSIDLNRDSDQALQFIKEKIVDKCFQPSCMRPSCSKPYP
jgi:hypothetical protein